jgi:hypothetical protein
VQSTLFEADRGTVLFLTSGARLQRELSDTHPVFDGHETILSSGTLVFYLLERASVVVT